MNLLVTIITPAYNEEQNLPEFVRRAAEIGPALENHGAALEIVIVDDHSSDRTPLVARQLLTEHPNLKYLRLSRNFGAHAAISAGLKYCAGACAIIMAADLQDPPEIIPELLERWREGNDVVWACRSQRVGESLASRAASNMYYRLMRWIALPEMPAKGADFLLMSRKVIDAYNAISEKHTSLLSMILWMGFRQVSVEYVKQARHAGTSKWTFAKKLKLFIDSMVSFSYVPIRLMSLLGLLMAISGFVYALVVVVSRLTGSVTAGTGYAALMTVLLVGQGTILLTLGILGEYLWRTFDEARGRPRYIIEEYVTSNGQESTPHTKDTSP